jgi:geranylgeranyl reductase family protein
MKRPDFDVIVVGAGAGGAAAAYYLAQAGLQVLVVEKTRLPRYKACGGAIPRPTLERFPFDFTNVIQAAPTDVRMRFPALPPVDIALPDRPVVMVMRSEFDAFLLARSEAEVIENASVTTVAEDGDQVQVTAGTRTLTARYLVGADGAASKVARCLGLRCRRRLGGALEAEVPLSGKHTLREEYGSRAVFTMGVVPWGYAWIFPKGDHLSVGIGQVRPERTDLRAALQREMGDLGVRLNGAQVHGHPLPCYRAAPWPLWSGPARITTGSQPQERLASRRCLLVGDAAGLVDPLIGEGVRYAITSARLAAEAIARDTLSGYEMAIWRELGHNLATAGLMAHTYYRIPRVSYQLGLRNPATMRHMLDVLIERASYKGIGRKLIAAMLRWPLARGKGSR